MKRPRRTSRVQTTLRLPRELHEQLHSWVERQSPGPDSINDLAVRALTFYLKMLRRARVDASFAEMANDPHFKRETEKIMKEFEYADAEAFRLSEQQAG